MQKRTYKEAVDLMVNWWVEKSFNTTLNQNNGDNTKNGIFSFALMNTLSGKAQKEITQEQIQLFSTKLTELLLEAEQEHSSDYTRHYTELDVDYNPNPPLEIACKTAGISTLCLPVKTFTYIDQDFTVNGRYQYGGDWFKM